MSARPIRYTVVDWSLTRLPPKVATSKPNKIKPLPLEIPEPTLAELASNFSGAMERWASAGFKTVTPEVYEARGAICATCEFWDGSARFGLGKCKAPGCGCTKFKRWLATEKCPLKKWAA